MRSQYWFSSRIEEIDNDCVIIMATIKDFVHRANAKSAQTMSNHTHTAWPCTCVPHGAQMAHAPHRGAWTKDPQQHPGAAQAEMSAGNGRDRAVAQSAIKKAFKKSYKNTRRHSDSLQRELTCSRGAAAPGTAPDSAVKGLGAPTCARGVLGGTGRGGRRTFFLSSSSC